MQLLLTNLLYVLRLGQHDDNFSRDCPNINNFVDVVNFEKVVMKPAPYGQIFLSTFQFYFWFKALARASEMYSADFNGEKESSGTNENCEVGLFSICNRCLIILSKEEGPFNKVPYALKAHCTSGM